MNTKPTPPIAIFAAALLGCVAANVPARAADQPVSLNVGVSLVPADYRHQLVQQLSLAEDNSQQWLDAIARARPEHREAVAFLLAYMPQRDLKSLKGDFLLHNVELAYQAREANPWAAAVPQEIFFNDVLPYANLNEQRDDWRADFMKRFMPLVKDCKTAGDVAQVLNREVFKQLNVKYHATKRRKPDQSPYESMKIGYASCSGLSIILVDACRAVGVPARVVGTPLWSNGSGNHTWLEVWDGQWRFLGAAEPGPYNQTWFGDLASKADGNKAENRIYAASFRQTPLPFVMVWNRRSTDYSADDQTGYYVQRKTLKVSVLDESGKPAAATVRVRRAGELIAQAVGPTPSFELAADSSYSIEASVANGPPITKETHLPRDADMNVELRLADNHSPAAAR